MELNFGSVKSDFGKKNLLQSIGNQIPKNSLRGQGYYHEEVPLKFWRYVFKIKVDLPYLAIGN